MNGGKIAVVFCSGGNNCSDRFIYDGVRTCAAAEMMFGGQKSCKSGCLGFGDCSLACGRNAISLKTGGLPVINAQKCDGCGDCVNACPKKLISLAPRARGVQIKCSSLEKSNHIKAVCKGGCISCGICVKICPLRAIINENSTAMINFSKCNLCGLCIEKCPANTINRILTD